MNFATSLVVRCGVGLSSGQWVVCASDYATSKTIHKNPPKLSFLAPFPLWLAGLKMKPLGDLRSYMLIPGTLCGKEPPR